MAEALVNLWKPIEINSPKNGGDLASPGLQPIAYISGPNINHHFDESMSPRKTRRRKREERQVPEHKPPSQSRESSLMNNIHRPEDHY